MRYLIYLLALVCAQAATPVFSAPPELSDWKAVRGLTKTDKSELHDGKKSLLVEAGTSTDARVLEIYNSLRPYRSTKQELLDIASELENKYQAQVCAAHVREACKVYERRNRIKK